MKYEGQSIVKHLSWNDQEPLGKGEVLFHIIVTLSAKKSLILGENKAAFRREGH